VTVRDAGTHWQIVYQTDHADFLRAGYAQSETWTVALPPGSYHFHCDVFPPMSGSFTVTP
jgi:hypothetical protein